VLIDGKFVGPLPWMGRVSVGQHRVAVELDGYVSQENVINTPTKRDARVTLTFNLPLLAGYKGRPTSEPESKPSPWNFVVGGALTAIAIPALYVGTYTLITNGNCVDSVANGCETVDFNALTGVLLGAGIIAAGGAAYMFIAQPIRVTPQVSKDYAGANMSIAF